MKLYNLTDVKNIKTGKTKYRSPNSNIEIVYEKVIKEDDQWHSATSDQWHGTGGAEQGVPAMKEADTATRLKQNLRRGGFDMDSFDAKIAEIERRNQELADEFYARHPELDDRIKDVEEDNDLAGALTGLNGVAAAQGSDNICSPIGSGTMDEDQYGGGYGGGSVAPVTDSTSPVGGGGASVEEGQLEFNTPDPVVVIQDKQGKMLDQMNLSVAAQKYRLGQPENIKNQLAHQNYTTIGNYVVVSPMSGQPQDSTTQKVPEAKEPEITEDIYESRLYKMKLAGYEIK